MPIAVAGRHLYCIENFEKPVMPTMAAKSSVENLMSFTSLMQTESLAQKISPGARAMSRILKNSVLARERPPPKIDQRYEMGNVLKKITRKIGSDGDVQASSRASVDVPEVVPVARVARLQKPKIIVNVPVSLSTAKPVKEPRPKPEPTPEPPPLKLADFRETGLVCRQDIFTFLRQYAKNVAVPKLPHSTIRTVSQKARPT